MSTPSEQPAAPKKNKWTTLAYGFAAICLGVAALANFAGVIDSWGSQVDEANNQLDLAQVSIVKGDKHDDEGTKLTHAVFSDENLADFPSSRVKYRADAEKAITELESSAASYREASALIEKAAGMKVKQSNKDQWNLQAKRYGKLAEMQLHRVAGLKLALDETFTEVEKFGERLSETGKLRKEAEAQAAEFGNQADKVKQDHPHDFVK